MASLRRSVTCASESSCSSMRIAPVFSTVNVSGCSAAPSVDRERGSCTLSVCATMYVEATIMMMSSTSTTSTSGVTLMPEIIPFLPPPRVPATSGLHRQRELAGCDLRVVGLLRVRLHLREDVVGQRRRVFLDVVGLLL